VLKAQSPPHIVTLILLTAFSTLSLNMFLPSLASIAADFSADYSTVSLSVAGYLAVTAVIQLIVGPLSDRIGRRPVLLVALLLFTCASLACALAQDVWTFLAFRMLQAGMISGYAISLAIVRDTTSERQTAALIGNISMAMAIAPMLGPMLGGVLDTAFGWRANFFFYAISGLVLLMLCWVDLGETKPEDDGLGNSRAENVGTLVCEPLFWAYSLSSAFSTGAFYIFLTGSPLVATSTFGVTTAELGFYIGTITAGFFLGSFLSGRLAPRYEPTTMMLAGRITACLGLSIGLVVMLSGYLSTVLFFGSTVFVGLGNGLTIPSSNAAAMSVRPRLAGSAAGLSGALAVAGGAMLTSLTGLVLPEEGAAPLLLLLMLVASSAGLIAVVVAIRLLAAKPK
jgi:MFS transporter, DHA1 family, multidrug resistance protein